MNVILHKIHILYFDKKILILNKINYILKEMKYVLINGITVYNY